MKTLFDRLQPELLAILGDSGLLIGADVAQRSDSWTGRDPCQALGVALPRNTAEVAAILRLCHRAGLPVVPQAGKTTLVQGCATRGEELVLSLERMNAIECCDAVAATMTVQAGVPLQRIQERAEAEGLMFPVDLGARGSCTIGGNIATNAGGIRVIRYGMTRKQVLGLEVVLADGSVLDSMNGMLKNNAGYDLKQLFIGSEGTLGIVTRACLRLQPRPLSEQTAILAVGSFAALGKLLRRAGELLGGQLSAFEVMWQSHYQVVAVDSQRHTAPLPAHFPYYVLVETLGSDPQRDTELFQQAMERVMEEGLAEDAVIAQSRAQRDALWAIREDIPALVLAMKSPLSYDISLPIGHMERYVGELEQALRKTWGEQARLLVFGHLGDGNLHLAISVGEDTPENRAALTELVYRPLQVLNGSISAEHGIGLEKRAYLGYSRNAGEITLMRLLKQTLDPKGILNPGKVLGN